MSQCGPHVPADPAPRSRVGVRVRVRVTVRVTVRVRARVRATSEG